MTTMAAPPIAPSYEFAWGPSPVTTGGSGPNLPRITPDFSPPLIAMVAVVGTAFLIVLYARILSRQLRLLRRRWRRWRRRRRLLQSTAAASDLESPPPFGGAASFGSSSDFFLSPYGLDDAAIKALPVSLFSRAKAKHLAVTNRECAVCLLEFEDDDTLRTLPLCAHAFHMDCIDVWLRSHATCPLCRAAVLRHEAIFAPMRAARIRPSLDDILVVDPLPPTPPDPGGVAILPDLDPDPEITPAAASPLHTEDGFGPRDFLLKRSYSFGFERSLAAERMVLEASTASPWRYRQHRGGFWSKRWPSPFGGSYSASRAPRVFSFRSYRGAAAAATLAKSPAFFKRRGFFPLSSEPSGRLSTGAGPSSRRSRSMTSPSSLLLRPTPSSSLAFSSSRIRCGDPEALLSPDRLK